jgi:hypothetical protein
MLSNRSPMQRLHEVGNDLLLWGLARAFNPAAVSRMRLFRDHQELWISRISLQRIYRRAQQRASGAKCRGEW